MQTLALAFAIFLLSLGALLNTVVLAYFAWRAWRVIATPRLRRRTPTGQALAPAHR